MHISVKNIIHRESSEKKSTCFYVFLVICPLMESLTVVLSFYSTTIKNKETNNLVIFFPF